MHVSFGRLVSFVLASVVASENESLDIQPRGSPDAMSLRAYESLELHPSNTVDKDDLSNEDLDAETDLRRQLRHATNNRMPESNRGQKTLDSTESIARSVPHRSKQVPVRAFPTWKDARQGSSLPCIVDVGIGHPDSMQVQKTGTTEGLLFVKLPKCGSTTLAGVAARIGHVLYKRLHRHRSGNAHRNEACRYRGTRHQWQRHVPLRQRDRRVSFLWTVVRSPDTRLLSQYFHFKVSRNKASTRDHAVLSYLKKQNWRNLQLKHGFPDHARDYHRLEQMGDRGMEGSVNNALWYPIIQDNLEIFDFVGVLERLDESLVVLQLLMGLRATDVLPLSAKQSGNRSELDLNTAGQCNRFVEPFRSPKVDEYLRSDTFRRFHQGDILLYEAANRSLDATIESLGRERFDGAMQEYLKAKELAERFGCGLESPCQAEGVLKDPVELAELCYLDDIGCGHHCLDNLFAE